MTLGKLAIWNVLNVWRNQGRKIRVIFSKNHDTASERAVVVKFVFFLEVVYIFFIEISKPEVKFVKFLHTLKWQIERFCHTPYSVNILANVLTKKIFESKANRPLADRCMGDIANKFEQVLGAGAGWGGSQVNKFEQVHVRSHREPPPIHPLLLTNWQIRLKTLPSCNLVGGW